MGSPANDLASWLTAPHMWTATRSAFDEFLQYLVEDGETFPPEAYDDAKYYFLDLDEEYEKYEERFEEWAQNLDGDDREQYMEEYPTAYVETMGTSSSFDWFLHFTNRKFTGFNVGVPRKYLGASRDYRGDQSFTCPANLKAPRDDQRWVHAFSVYDPGDQNGDINYEMLSYGLGYGNSALLFQSKEAVHAKHAGYEQWHALVLGCSEYNAVYLTELRIEEDEETYEKTLAGVAQLVTGDVEFKDIRKLIEMLEAKKTSLGGFGRVTNKPSRWHRLAQRY